MYNFIHSTTYSFDIASAIIGIIVGSLGIFLGIDAIKSKSIIFQIISIFIIAIGFGFLIPIICKSPLLPLSIGLFLTSAILIIKSNTKLSGVFKSKNINNYTKTGIVIYSFLSGLALACESDFPIWLIHKHTYLFSLNKSYIIEIIIGCVSIISSLIAIKWYHKLIKEYSSNHEFNVNPANITELTGEGISSVLSASPDPSFLFFFDSDLLALEGEIALIFLAILLLPLIAMFAGAIFLGLIAPYCLFFSKIKTK